MTTTAGPRSVHVPLGDRAYDVQIGAFAPEQAAASLAASLGKTTALAVLVDETVAARPPRVAPRLDAAARRLPVVRRYELRGGEACRTLAEIGRTCEWLAAQGFDRGA